MKAEIHPKTFETTITCTCGAVYNTISTVQNLRVGICSACHPFFTGKQKLIDTEGRVDRFQKKLLKSAAIKAARETASAN